jgi:hypothetical protein
VRARVARPFALAAMLVVMRAGAAGAQNTDFSLAGAPSIFPAPTAADLSAGWLMNPTGVGFTVAVGRGAATRRLATVTIQATSATMTATAGSHAKPVGDLEWRRADLAAWVPLTTAPVEIESRLMRKNTLEDPWGNTIFLRTRLSWTGDPPDTYTATLVITLTTVPQ